VSEALGPASHLSRCHAGHAGVACVLCAVSCRARWRVCCVRYVTRVQVPVAVQHHAHSRADQPCVNDGYLGAGGVWRVACGVWRVACDVWRVTCGVWRVACGV
jgi:hypothetical protein